MSTFAGNLGRVTWLEPNPDRAARPNEIDPMLEKTGTVVEWIVRNRDDPWAILVEDGSTTFRCLPMYSLRLAAAE